MITYILTTSGVTAKMIICPTDLHKSIRKDCDFIEPTTAHSLERYIVQSETRKMAHCFNFVFYNAYLSSLALKNVENHVVGKRIIILKKRKKLLLAAKHRNVGKYVEQTTKRRCSSAKGEADAMCAVQASL